MKNVIIFLKISIFNSEKHQKLFQTIPPFQVNSDVKLKENKTNLYRDKNSLFIDICCMSCRIIYCMHICY